jgi:anti-sigma factor RsiW
MAHEEWLERAEIYGLSALDGDELTQFEAHLAAECPVCERHVRETRESLAVLARSLAPLTPPPQVKATLLHQITPVVAPSIPGKHEI